MGEVKLKECRVCLNLKTENSKFISLFETYKNKLVHEHISSFADVTITSGDGLPDQVCEACLTDLDNCLIFRQTCESSAHLLHIRTLQSVPDVKEEKQEEFENYLPDESSCNDVKFEPVPEPIIERNGLVNNCRVIVKKSPECSDCGKCFKSKIQLLVHWKKVHKSKTKSQYVCPSCKKTFGSFNGYNNHITKKYRQSCPLGSKEFLTDISIKGEGKSRIFYCLHCYYNSKRLGHMKAHLVTHSGVRSFKCNMCNKAYTQLSSLISHKDIAHKLRVFQCNICRKTFKSKRYLNRHAKTHYEGKLQCNICNKQYKEKSTLQGHLLRHSGVKSFMCEQCARGFFSLKALRKHQISHSGLRSFECDMCDRAYTQPSSLLSHKESVHLVLDVTECHICGKTFKGKSRLYKHVKRHNEEKLQCHLCDKQLKGKRNMQIHMLRHSGMRLFTCELCVASFYTLGELTHHKKIHAVDRKKKTKDFQCDLCQYRSTTKYVLSLHIKLHMSGEKNILI